MEEARKMVDVMSLRAQGLKFELGKLQELYPEEVVLAIPMRYDPADFREHDENCRKMGENVIVILPKDRPIPAAAMERGVPHVVFLQDGKPMLLVQLVAVLKPFDPTEPGCIGEGDEVRMTSTYNPKQPPYTPED